MSLEKLRVLELGQSLSVAYCGLQFARWGAQVYVERQPQLSTAGPLHASRSLTHRYLTANKIRIDDAQNWLDKVDLIICDQPFDHEVAAIVHRVTPFPEGQSVAADSPTILYEALSGFMSVNGEPDREPARMPGNMVAYIAGVSAFIASLAAIHKRLRTGCVEKVETCELDALTTITPFVRGQHTGEPDLRHGGPQTGVRLFPVGDGFVSANLFGKSTFAKVLEIMGLTLDDVPDHLKTPEQRYDVAALNAYLKSISGDQRAETFFDEMLRAGFPPVGLYKTPAQLLDEKHLNAINYFQSYADPDLGELAYPGAPARFSRIEQSAPEPLTDRMPDKHPSLTWPPEQKSNERPLAGVRIVDFTQAWIGPYATMLLADLGAEVVKIESHKRVDVWRNWPGNIPSKLMINDEAHPLNTSGNFNSTNRNKREIAIDLSHPEGAEVARSLIKDADIVIDNYTPRVMEKFGLDYESLKLINPGLICVAWSGYGRTGPYADFKANGTTIEALAGWDALFGYHDGDPMVMGFYQADAITGLQLAACTLLALVHRDLTGEGQFVTGSMIEAAVSYIGEEILLASTGAQNSRWGNRHPDVWHQGIFPCLEEDTYLAIVCRTKTDWRHLSAHIGCTKSSPTADEIDEALGAWSAGLERDTAISALRDIGIPCSEVLDSLEVLSHEVFTSRTWFQPQFHPDMGEKLFAGFPWQFEQSKLTAHRAPPRLGEHSAEILHELGYSQAVIDHLFETDIVGCVLTREQ